MPSPQRQTVVWPHMTEQKRRNAQRREIDGIRLGAQEAVATLSRRADSLERLASRNAREGKMPGHDSKMARADKLRRAASLLTDARLFALALEDERLAAILLSLGAHHPTICRSEGRRHDAPIS